jgi:hypothetical protein
MGLCEGQKMSSVKETIQAGQAKEFYEPGDFFRLLETTAPVTVEFYCKGRKTVDLVEIEAGYAEYFRAENQEPFDRVKIYSATTQAVKFVTRFGSDVRYDRGASSVTGTVSLDAATLAALEQINVRPEQSNGNYKSQTALAANTPDQVFSAAANTNGAIILAAGASDLTTAGHSSVTLLSKATAPANPIDGEIYAVSISMISNVASEWGGFNLAYPQYVAPGQGLYFISGVTTAGGVQTNRFCRYKLL